MPRLSVDVTEELHAVVRAAAERMGLSISDAVRQACVVCYRPLGALVRVKRPDLPAVVVAAMNADEGAFVRALEEGAVCSHPTERKLPYGVFCADPECGAKIR